MVDLNFSQVVIFGPLLHEHPISWMFYGYCKAFTYKRYQVIWVNQETRKELESMDLSNSLFITDGEHDDNIPLRHDSFYLLFQNKKDKYLGYNSLYLNLYGNDLVNVKTWKDKSYIKYSLETRELYFPLATELVPQEILINQQNSILTYPGNTRNVCLLGNISDGNNVSKIFGDIKANCVTNFYNLCVVNNFTSEDRATAIKTCRVSPIISSDYQLDRGEIDYRVFQAISYGGFPVTNSKITRDLFDPNCIYYADNGRDLLLKGIEHRDDTFTDQWKWKLMENIKNNHTYVKRIDTIFWILMRL